MPDVQLVEMGQRADLGDVHVVDAVAGIDREAEFVRTHATETEALQLLRATRAAETGTGPARHSQQTEKCPNIARFAAVYRFGASWTAGESAHVANCPFCQKVLDMFATAASKIAQMDTVTGLSSEEETHRSVNVKKPPSSGPDDKSKQG